MGVGFLALWAAANARERNGWLIAAALGFGALGDWLLDAKGLETGAVAFVVGHLIAIILYLTNRRAVMTTSQRLDRTSVVSGKSVAVRVDLGGRRTHKKK